MNYLLDTHVFLWALGNPKALSREARQLIQDPKYSVFVSAVSSVEISIKQALGKLEAPPGLEKEIEQRGFQELPLTYAHGSRMVELPSYHQDPFDRMLLAQALHEGLVLITRDKKLKQYPVKCVMT